MRKYLNIGCQVLGFTADNASNNNTLADELADLLNGFQGSLTCVHCFAHILNLVVKVWIRYLVLWCAPDSSTQAILSQFSQKNKATADLTEDAADEAAFKDLDDTVNEEEDNEAAEADIEDTDVLEPSVEASDNAVIDEVIAELEEDSAEMPPLTRAEINLGHFAITKVYCNLYTKVLETHPYYQLRNLAKRIFNSPTIRADLEIACTKSNTKPALMICDVATWWNSTSELLERALHLRKALTVLVGLEQHNKPRTARLQWSKLMGAEWELLEQLWSLLNLYLCSISLSCTDTFII